MRVEAAELSAIQQRIQEHQESNCGCNQKRISSVQVHDGEESASRLAYLIEEECGEFESPFPAQLLCPVEEAARIVGQKWTLQIVHSLIGKPTCRFCELQHALGGVNPSTLSSRLKMLEEEGLVQRIQVSSIPPHVEYKLTEMGEQLSGVIHALTQWSRVWLCNESVES